MSKRLMNNECENGMKRKKMGSSVDRQEKVDEEFEEHAVKDEQETMKKRVTWAQVLVKEYNYDDEQKMESDSEDDMEKEDSDEDKDEEFEEDKSCGEKVHEKTPTKKRVTWDKVLVREYTYDVEQNLESDSEDDMDEEDKSCGEKVDEKKATKKRVTWAHVLVLEYSYYDEKNLESDSEDDKDEVDSEDDKEEEFEEDVVQKKGLKKLKTAKTEKGSKKAPKKATKKSAEDEPLYLIEALVGHKKRNGQIVFFVKWLNYPESDNTWEPLESFETSRQFVYNYLDKEGLESWVADVAEFYSRT